MYRIELVDDNSYEPIYHQNSSQEPLPCYNPRLSLEVNEAGSLEFTIMPWHPLANRLYPLCSFVRMTDDGEEIFYGRVMTRNVSKVSGEIRINCEGALAFLLDSEIPPYGRDNRGNQITYTKTAGEFLTDCINAHNSDIGNDWRRRFTIGNITANKASEQTEYSITSYTQTRSAIQSNLIDRYGGFLRLRVAQNGYDHIIDWVQHYDNLDHSPITLGVNVEDMAHEFDCNELYTVIRPVCTDNNGNPVYLTEQTLDVYSDPEYMTAYGRIVRTVEFKDATNEATLRTKAQEYIQNMNSTLLVSSTVQYIDMHYLDGTQPKVRLGDRYDNIEGLPSEEYTVTAIDIDADKPENDTITLDNPKRLEVNDTGSTSSSSKSSLAKSSGKGSGIAKALKYFTESGDTAFITAQNLQISVDELHANVTGLYEETAAEFRRISSDIDTVNGLVDNWQRYVDGIHLTVEQLSGTAVFQNSDFISNLAGQFEIWTGDNGKVTIHLVDGADLSIDDENGVSQSVGERIQQTITDHQIIDTISGSALWMQRDNITGVCGEYDIVTNPSTGERTLIVKSGGGLKIRRNNVEYGLYDSGTLTGGIIVNKLRDGTVNTTISGDIVDLTTNSGYAQLRADNDGVKTTVAQHTTSINTFMGSTLWTQRSNITGVCGEFDVVTNPTTGSQSLVIKSGGGLKVRRNGVEYGLYDNGTLTGGIIANKLNDGTVTTKISGNIIQVGDGNSTITLNDVIDISGSYTLMRRPVQVGSSLTDNTTILGGTVRANHFSTNNGGDVKIYSSEGQYVSLNYSSLANMLTGVTVNGGTGKFEITDGSGKTYTITKSGNELIFRDVAGGQQFSFNKATTVSGSWSGANYTVTAMQNGVNVAGTSANTSVHLQITGAPNPNETVYTNLHKENLDPANIIDTRKLVLTENVNDKKVYLRLDVNGDGSAYLTKGAVSTASTYNAGWSNCYSDIGLNYSSDQTITTNGGSVTIYPAAMPTPSGQHASITSKGITVTANIDDRMIRYAGSAAVGLAANSWTYPIPNVSGNTNTVVVRTTGRVNTTGAAANLERSIKIVVTSDQNVAYARLDSDTGTIVAVANHNMYTYGYNNGWNYGQTKRVRTTGAAGANDVIIHSLSYGERFKITDTYTKANGTTEAVTYTVSAPPQTASYSMTSGSFADIKLSSTPSGYTAPSGKNYYIKSGTSGAGTVVRVYYTGDLTIDGTRFNYPTRSHYTAQETTPTQIFRDGYAEGAASANAGTLQAITVSPGSTAVTYYPEGGYYGLSQVTVSAALLQGKVVSPSGSAQTITASSGYYGLAYVTINAATLQGKTVDPSTSATTYYPDSGYYGLSYVTVKAAPKQEKTVNASTTGAVSVTPDSGYYGLSKVTVNQINLQAKTVNASTTGAVNVTPDSGYAGLSKVTISRVQLQAKTVSATTSARVITPDSGYVGLQSVTINAVNPVISYSNGHFNASTQAAAGTSQYYVQMSCDTGWSSDKKLNVYTKYGATSPPANTALTMTIDGANLYRQGWNDGWNAYYYDSADWISAWDNGGGNYSVWVPKRAANANSATAYNFYDSPSGRGKGNGSSSTCETWFTYTSGTTVSCNHRRVSPNAFTCTITEEAGGSRYKYTLTASISSGVSVPLNSGQTYVLYI